MKPAPLKPLSPPQERYLRGTIFLTGAVALMLEIVGTRVISPYYGSSLYCWSALITVTLIALAAGYHWGGRRADRDPRLSLFAGLTCAAAAAVALVPVLREPVLRATTPLGIQLGALASAALLIAPALVCLSALGPLAVRLSTSAVDNVGRTSGGVYAVSTLGSVAGAALSGFVLIPHVAISHILYGTSCLLLLAGAAGLRLSSGRAPLKELAAAAAVGLFGFWPRTEFDTNVRLNKESAYGQIKVLDFKGRRYLLVNGTTQSMTGLGGSDSASQYAQAMEWAALSRPRARRALVIGIGAGLLSGSIETNYGITADAVDIDPGIVSAAREFFGYAPRGEVYLEDGRTFLDRPGARYGMIFLDAFGSETPPYQLFTREAFTAMRRRLEPGGILAINLVTMLHPPGNGPWLSAYKTLTSVFPTVRAFQASPTYDDLGNVVFFCSDAPLPDEGAPALARPAIRENLAVMLSRELKPSPAHLAAAPTMTDDFAPMEFLLAQTAVRWRGQLQRKVPEILLY